MEERIKTLTQEGAVLEARLPTTENPAEITAIGRALASVTDELAQLEERWLELSMQMEGA